MAGALRGQIAHRAVVEDDRQRNDRLPRPAREVVDRERKRRLQEDQLRRELRDLVPRPEAEEREPDPREDPRAADTAPLLAEAAGRREPLVVRRESGQAERRVGLERRREVGLAAPVDRPEPVGPLPREQLVGTAAGRVVVPQPQELEQQQVLRSHGHVGLELADPPAVGPLQAEKSPYRSVQRPLQLLADRPCRRPGSPRLRRAHVVTVSLRSARHSRASPRYARKRVEGGVPHT